MNKLDDRNIVFDLHSLEAKVAYRVELRLLYNAIATAYLKQALNRTTTDEISNMFVADEAQLLAPRILRKLVITDTWTTTEFATRLRKRGLSIVIISQSPSNIEEDIRKNCQNNFYFRIQDSKDIELVARSLGYNWYTSLDYFTHYLNSLQQRQTIVKTPLIDEPFIIEAPEVGLKAIAKEEIKAYIPKVKLSFSEDEEGFLESINSFPFIPVAERRRTLGWDKRRFSDVVTKLVENGIIEKVNVPMGRGRPIVLFQLKGANPSIKHEYYVDWLVRQLAGKGYVLRLGKKLGPDIQIPSIKTAINIELGTSDIQGNISSALKEFDRVIVCSNDNSVLDKIVEFETKEGKRLEKALVWDVPKLFEAIIN
ncbi:MAG: ATP-binding protein [archaeon]|nr:ATP-binding protein [archaeon]